VELPFLIERLNTSSPRPRPAAAVLETNLQAIPGYAAFIAPSPTARPQKLHTDGYVDVLAARQSP
jgi:hypothetical protein